MDHDQRLVMMLCMTIYDYCIYVWSMEYWRGMVLYVVTVHRGCINYGLFAVFSVNNDAIQSLDVMSACPLRTAPSLSNVGTGRSQPSRESAT
jgi:hypothetical protein